jgi:hypothetical protein
VSFPYEALLVAAICAQAADRALSRLPGRLDFVFGEAFGLERIGLHNWTFHRRTDYFSAICPTSFAQGMSMAP